LYSLAFILAILGTTTSMSEMRYLKKRRIWTENTEKHCLLKNKVFEDGDSNLGNENQISE
jgi:hypothetical protein